jgi:transposase
VSGSVLRGVLDQRTLAVAIDPGKVANRVWLTTGERGLIAEPVTLPVFRRGVDELCRLISNSGVAGSPVIGIEATGALHRAWATELERRFPGSLRLFAPSETQAARAQLGARRFKTDDRDCAAPIWLLRQGAGRRPEESSLAALAGTVSYRRQLVAQLKPLRQRLHVH